MSVTTAAREAESIDIELFAGAGGLALGLQAASFRPDYLYELDRYSCATLRANHFSGGGLLHGQVVEGDVRSVDWTSFVGKVRLLSGGAPCQPFSLAGKHLANKDGRNLFPEVMRAIRSLHPAAVVLENVRGLTRPSFSPYFNYILRQLECPSVLPKEEELWEAHDGRLQQCQRGKHYQPEYHVSWGLLNAANYGIPQIRQRVFFVATRSDVLPRFEFAKPTHSRAALITDLQSGRYWKRHRMDPRPLKLPSNNGEDEDTRAAADLLPWRTVRDALAGLPSPARTESEAENNHWLIPGARLYPGHEASDPDWPAKTIKAGVHGVPGGENTVHLDDGTFRYFTLRETARIQGFPDTYRFAGARIHVTRQIGNAVPCPLATVVGKTLMSLMVENGLIKRRRS